MENSLKNELDRMFTLMEYSYSESKNFIKEGEYTDKKEEKKDISDVFGVTRIGGNKIKIQSKLNGCSMDVDFSDLEQLIQKLSEFKTI